MGWSFRKSFRIGKGLRINLSRRGIGWSIGSKILRFGSSGGRKRISSGVGPFRYEKTVRDSSGKESGGFGCGAVLLGLVVLGSIGALVTPKKVQPVKADNATQLEKPSATAHTATPRAAVPVVATPAPATIPRVGVQKPSASGPRQLPTGHAADAAKWRAVAIYPKLGVPNSPLNMAFLARVKRYQTELPEVFDDKDWPTVIARECEQESAR